MDSRWRPGDELHCSCPAQDRDPRCAIHGEPMPQMGSEGCKCAKPYDRHPWQYVFDCPHHKHMWQPRHGMAVPRYTQLLPADLWLIYWLPPNDLAEDTLQKRILCLALIDNGTTEPLVWSQRRQASVPAKVFVDDEMRWNDKSPILKYEIVESAS